MNECKYTFENVNKVKGIDNACEHMDHLEFFHPQSILH